VEALHAPLSVRPSTHRRHVHHHRSPRSTSCPGSKSHRQDGHQVGLGVEYAVSPVTTDPSGSRPTLPPRLQPPYRRTAAGTGGKRLDLEPICRVLRSGRRRRGRCRGRIVEQPPASSSHGVSPCPPFTLPAKVASFFLSRISKRGGFDLYRLVAICAKSPVLALWHSLHRALRVGIPAGDHASANRGRNPAVHDPPIRVARVKNLVIPYFWLADLPSMARLGWWAGSSG